MTKPDGKYIVFCSGREHMDEMKEQATDWFSKVDKSHTYTQRTTTKHRPAKPLPNSKGHRKPLKAPLLHRHAERGHTCGRCGRSNTASPYSVANHLSAADRQSPVSRKQNQPVIFDLVNNFDSLYCIDCLKTRCRKHFAVSGHSLAKRAL